MRTTSRPAGIRPRWIRRLPIGLALAVALLQLGSAHAAFSVCRTDPVVTLSNGVTVQIDAAVTDDLSDVKRVDYQLHGPKGTSVISVAYSGDISPSLESFSYVADQWNARYPATTTVTTGRTAQPVTANETIGSRVVSATGTSGSTIATLITLSTDD